jgi:hypothetical protein
LAEIDFSWDLLGTSTTSTHLFIHQSGTMAENQPPTIVEGATTGDVEDEVPVAKSAEDRKAAAALSSLDTPRDDEAAGVKDVDQEAVRKAMDRLAGTGTANGTTAKKEEEKKSIKKVVKVDQADVALLVGHWGYRLTHS